MDMTLGLRGTHVVVTGAAGLIGSVVTRAFLAAGCNVSCLDLAYGDSGAPAPVVETHRIDLQCDISSEASVQTAFSRARSAFGPVLVTVALAALDLSVLDHHESSITLAIDQWRRAIDVNITGTFLTAREWLRGLEEVSSNASPRTDAVRNASLIIVGSESGRFGERTNAAYSTSKSAVQGGLMLSFAADAPRVLEGAR